jgi:hypothetical protein
LGLSVGQQDFILLLYVELIKGVEKPFKISLC